MKITVYIDKIEKIENVFLQNFSRRSGNGFGRREELWELGFFSRELGFFLKGAGGGNVSLEKKPPNPSSHTKCQNAKIVRTTPDSVLQ